MPNRLARFGVWFALIPFMQQVSNNCLAQSFAWVLRLRFFVHLLALELQTATSASREKQLQRMMRAMQAMLELGNLGMRKLLGIQAPSSFICKSLGYFVGMDKSLWCLWKGHSMQKGRTTIEPRPKSQRRRALPGQTHFAIGQPGVRESLVTS